MDDICINMFISRTDNRVKPLESLSWEKVVKLFLSDHKKCEEKEDAPLFNAAVYKNLDEVSNDPKYWDTDYWSGDLFVTRRRHNVKELTLLILDYDNGLTISEAKDRFAQYEYVGYTSYRHLTEDNIEKFRLIFPLRTAIPAWTKLDERGRDVEWGEWYFLREALEEFAGPCDPVSFQANTIY